MSHFPNIAFIGRAGSGKTTAAALLVKHYGYERLSFAAPLKVGCGTETDRGLLQRVGIGVRELCPDFWVNLLVDELVRRDENAFVVDDCRFPNEALRLSIEGFQVVRIKADRNARVLRLRGNGKLQDEGQLDHESETALDYYTTDYTIYNDAGPEVLALEVQEMLRRMVR